MPLKLIVGLGNPGDKYAKTRHNAGAWFVENLAQRFALTLNHEDKFFGFMARVQMPEHDFRLLIPTTFMNLSGQSVLTAASFYKILPHEILIAHDDLDLDPGTVRLKHGGGHGGHNGLRDIIPRITADFWRLRIGIGHPGSRDEVVNFVLHQPGKDEKIKIDESIERAESYFDQMLNDNMQKVMNSLHRI